MCKLLANVACNNAAFTCGTLPGMDDMHPTMRRLYDAAIAGRLIEGQHPQAELARKLNTSSQRLKNWENRGVAQQGAVEAQLMLGISASWVMRGEGDMFLVALDEAHRSDGPGPTEGVVDGFPPASLTATPLVPAGATPSGYVRFDLLDGAGGMGLGVVNQDYPEVVRQVEVAEWEVRRKLGFLPAPGRIALITGRGPSMRPRIDHGDVVMVDTTVTAFDGDGVYVINVGGETQIKMLQMRGDGLYVVSANPDYPAYPVKEGDGLHIGGRVVAAMGIKEL